MLVVVAHQPSSRILNDALFAALDGLRLCDSNGVDRPIEVVSIIRSSGSIWVQIAPAGHAAETIVVEIPSNVTAEQAVAAVREKWAARGNEPRKGENDPRKSENEPHKEASRPARRHRA